MGKTQKRKRNGNEHTKTVRGKEHDAARTSHQISLTDMKDWKWRDLWTPEWVGLLVIGIMLVIVPYFRGLYFDTDMMVVEQVLCLLILVTGIWKFVQSTRFRNTARFSGSRVGILYNPRHLYIFALLIPYLIGLWTAVAPYDNWMQLFRYFAYGIAFFIVAEALSRKRGADTFLQMAVQLSIGWTALFAIAATLGQVTYKDAVLGGRLSSVFQYPNTFGIIVAVGIVGGVLLTLRRTWWIQAVGGLFLIPMGYVFLLTLSRGAWMFFPIIYLLGMLLLPVRAQVAYIIHSVPLAAGTGLLLLALGTQLEGAAAGAVWLWTILSMLMGAIGYPLLAWFVTGRFMASAPLPSPAASETADEAAASRPGQARNGWRGLLPQSLLPIVIAAVLGCAVYAVLVNPAVRSLLPDAIEQRVAQINFETHSVIERGYFNQDAYEIYRDHVLFGAGGGGWRALFQQYQDYPYWSTQSHNYFSQLMVETGAVGLIVFAVIFLYYLWRGIRGHVNSGSTEERVARAYFLAVLLGLLGHSGIDFNMSFGYVGFLIFLALAAWQAKVPAQMGASHVQPQDKHAPSPAIARPLRLLSRALPVPVRVAQPAAFLLLLAVAALMIIPIQGFAEAQTSYAEVGKMLEAGEVEDALQKLERIVQKSPDHPSYHLTYGSVLVSIGAKQQEEQVLQKGLEHLRRSAELAPTNPQTLAQVAENLMRGGEGEEAFRYIRQALQYGPWDIQLYPIFMEIAYDIGDERLTKGDSEGAEAAWRAGLDALAQVGPMRESLDKLPETLNKGRAFGETEEMKLMAGKLHYRLGQFEEARHVLTPLQESQQEDIRRQAVLWSMAAEVYLGVPVEETNGYGTFLQHPDWGDELRQILTLQTLAKK